MRIQLIGEDIRNLCKDETSTPVLVNDIWVKLLRLTNDSDHSKYFLSDIQYRQALTDHLSAEDMAAYLNNTLLQPKDYARLFK